MGGGAGVGVRRGDLGIALIHSGMASAMAGSGFDVRAAALPIPDGGTRRLPVGGVALVVLADDPARQRAAFELIAKLVEPPAVSHLVEVSGISPVNQIAATDPRFLPGFLTANPLYTAGASAVPDAVSWFEWPGRNSAEIADHLNEEIILALRGQRSPQAALADAAAQAKTLLGAP